MSTSTSTTTTTSASISGSPPASDSGDSTPRLSTRNVVSAIGQLRNTQAEADLLQFKAALEAEKREKRRHRRGGESIASIASVASVASVTSVVSVISVRSGSRNRRKDGEGRGRERERERECEPRARQDEGTQHRGRRGSLSSPERPRTRRILEDMAHQVTELERCIHELAVEEERGRGR